MNESQVTRRRALTSSLTGAAALVALSGSGVQAVRAGTLHQEVPPDAPPPDAPPDASGDATGDMPAPDTAAQDADAAAMAGIQAVLDRQSAAAAVADRAAYMATIDQRNLTWRRVQNDLFAGFAARGGRQERYTVTRVQAKQDGYYKAWIDITPGGGAAPQAQAVWVFRPADDGSGWLHTEILNEQLGPRKTLESDHFKLSYYAWDDDIVDRTAAVAERGFVRVADKLGSAPAFKAQLSLNPTFGSHSGLQGQGTWAAYLQDSKNLILVRSIESFGAGTTAPDQSQDDLLLVALSHEYTHLVHDQIVPLVKLKSWINEGLADFVAQNLRPGTFSRALRAGKQVTLDKASDIIDWWTDPARGYTLSDIDLAYAESGYAVNFFWQKFGRDAFFDLCRQFAESRKWDESFSKVAGIGWDQYQSAWLAWSRDQLKV